jgi:geranylgeranyl pyrophosphate synthase
MNTNSERPMSWVEACDLSRPLASVESGVDQLCGIDDPLVPDVCGHFCGTAGKRLRPALVLLAARAACTGALPPISLAAAVEVLHTATLLHDDVVDEAATRRHRPSANRQWGNTLATLAGGYLFARAMHVFASSGRSINALAADTIEHVWRGQAEEARNAYNLDLDEETYLEIIKGKTAAMYGLACRAGGVAANAADEDLERLAAYGSDLGVGFQLVDDVLDVSAAEDVLGKPAAADLRRGVYTLPVLYTLSRGDAAAKRLRAILGHDDLQAHELQEAIDLLRANGSVHEAVSRASSTLHRAMQHLDGLPASTARDGLRLIAMEILDQAHAAVHASHPVASVTA